MKERLKRFFDKTTVIALAYIVVFSGMWIVIALFRNDKW